MLYWNRFIMGLNKTSTKLFSQWKLTYNTQRQSDLSTWRYLKSVKVRKMYVGSLRKKKKKKAWTQTPIKLETKNKAFENVCKIFCRISLKVTKNCLIIERTLLSFFFIIIAVLCKTQWESINQRWILVVVVSNLKLEYFQWC